MRRMCDARGRRHAERKGTWFAPGRWCRGVRANSGVLGTCLRGERAPGSDTGPPGSNARWREMAVAAWLRSSAHAAPGGGGVCEMNGGPTAVLVADDRQLVAETLQRV